jgi:CheY-like chemotaxis protein
MRVLLADDEMNVRSALRLLLEQESGISVAGEVTNYTELVSQVKNINPDLVLLDWELPGELGREFLNSIRREYPGTRGRRYRLHQQRRTAGTAPFAYPEIKHAEQCVKIERTSIKREKSDAEVFTGRKVENRWERPLRLPAR